MNSCMPLLISSHALSKARSFDRAVIISVLTNKAKTYNELTFRQEA